MLLVDDQLAVITKHKEHIEQANSKNEEKSQLDKGGSNSFLCSIEEKYPQYVRKDGKMNTKQVMGVLQVQEMETEKVRVGIIKSCTKNNYKWTLLTL